MPVFPGTTSDYGYVTPVSTFNTGSSFGVWGDCQNGFALIGSSDLGIGVRAWSSHGTALLATGDTVLEGDLLVTRGEAA
jgi:hypothetical protein